MWGEYITALTWRKKQKFKAAFVALSLFQISFQKMEKREQKSFTADKAKFVTARSYGNEFLSKQTQKWSRNVLNFPNNDFLASSASSSRWHSNWLCVDVLFISPAEKKGAGSKLKWLLWSINLHEKIIKGVGVGAPGTKWKLNSFGIEMVHCVVCNAWCSVWTGAKSILEFHLDDSFRLPPFKDVHDDGTTNSIML